MNTPVHSLRCAGVTRRSFLADTGLGFTGLALGAMLFKDGVARAEEQSGGLQHRLNSATLRP